ncbi:MAG: hypothetical protein A2289_03365 [Deltaproteobacteria bacterium RIFOXYA12_FULL_58_15]|nr:MAG: hypothetical protein A2289_03365 [Deltaproteobacteria bacterium RIFOXYA12_FULL_58_15]
MLRVALFGQNGPYAPIALRQLLEKQRAYEIVLVVQGLKKSSRVENRRLPAQARPLPPGELLADIGSAAGIPVLQTNDVNSRGAIEIIGHYDFDWLVCVGFDRLFTRAVLDTAKVGGINAHPSKLPELRGPSPVFWALRQGRRDLAVSLHSLDAGEDHGPIFAQQPFVLPRLASGADIFRIAGKLAGSMLAGLLNRAATGPLRSQLQHHSQATRAPRPKPEDAQVDPMQWSCTHLVDFASGAAYFRPAWMRLGTETFFARRGIRADLGRQLPAQYVLHGSTLVVQCRDGAAHLEIQE